MTAKKEVFKIDGMTCTACANAVERRVGRLDGVDKASVNFATETLTVLHEDGVDLERIKRAVEEAGYSLREEQKNREVVIPIEGMTCAACSRAVERALGKLDGVERGEVNLAAERARVVYNGGNQAVPDREATSRPDTGLWRSKPIAGGILTRSEGRGKFPLCGPNL